MTEKRRALLTKLESITYREFYSNYTKHSDYPDVVASDGSRVSRGIRDKIGKYERMTEYEFFKVMYKFGPNEYPIMGVLDDILQFLEKEYGLDVESKNETTE